MRARAMIPAQKPALKTTSFSHRTQKPNSSQSTNSPVDHILSLQRTIGNQAVQRLFKSGLIQKTLRMGQPGDIYEREADQMAGAVMLLPEPMVQRQLEEEKEELMQTKSTSDQPMHLIQRQAEPEEAATTSTKKLSGPDWCDKFPTSRKTDDLASGFKENVKKFIKALEDAGASVTISATKRPTERAHLMHYSFKLSKDKIQCDKIPSKTGVDIEWCHKDSKGNIDHEASRKAAQKMVDKYDIAYAPSLTSLHIKGKAIDMSISWSGDLKIKDHSGKEVIIKTTPRNGTNTKLHEIGKGYGVKKLVGDPPHWSSTGK